MGFTEVGTPNKFGIVPFWEVSNVALVPKVQGAIRTT
jgi:hypothetical protein